MHDLILRPRVRDYREGDLQKLLHGQQNALPPAQRVAFEHHLPGTDVLVALPVEAWPFLQGAMEARSRRISRWSGKLTPTEKAFAVDLLAELKQRGPLSPADLHDGRRSRTPGWGASSLAKATLQKLFFHGRVLIAGRTQNRRIYGLPEQVLPAEILARPPSTPQESERWRVLIKLQQRRLTTLTAAEFDLVGDEVCSLRVEGVDLPRLYHPKAYSISLASGQEPHQSIEPLAPLDPLIYDRKVTAALWDFNYTWEVYVTAAKRVRGYYALPVLAHGALVGHVEPVRTAAETIELRSRDLPAHIKIQDALSRLSTFLGRKPPAFSE